MSDNQSKIVIDENISAVKYQIAAKQSNYVHFGTLNEAEKTLTDFDHFPYTRFYRGVYHSSDPIALEREAGWRPQRKECYTPNCCIDQPIYPNHCFETACSTTFPCYPPSMSKYSNNEALAVQLNRACIVQYR